MHRPPIVPTAGWTAYACALAVLLVVAGPARAQCPGRGLSGAITTCTEAGGQPAGDAFGLACDVFLRAAPAGSSGLPDGDYVFQVTDPSGSTLLSLEGPQNGLITVAGGQGGFSAYSGSHQTAGDGAAGDLRVQLCPFAPTTNPGGVYKVWLTPSDCWEAGKGKFGFKPAKSKTHTFKLTGSPPPATAALVVQRFCDLDGDGDASGETLQDGVRYMVSVSTIDDGQPFEVTTGSGGQGTSRIDAIPTPATWTVCELVPGASTVGCYWWGTAPAYATTSGTAPACASGTLGADDVTTLVFGAACVCQATDGMARHEFLGGAGKALLEAQDPQWRGVLAGAQLVQADGSPYVVPAGSFRDAYASLAAWLTGDRSSNTAYALSTEAGTALLAAHFGALDASRTRMLRPDVASCLDRNAMTPAELLAAAEAAIEADGFTPSGDRNAVVQECLREALAGINTRALPLLNGHCCEPVYP